MTDSLTYYFEEIIPDYETWQGVVNEYDNIVNYDNVIESNFDAYCYKLLYRHFYNSNIRYDTPSAFLFELMNIYSTKFKQFLKEKSIIDKIYSLTNEDLEVIEESISNLANNPNDTISNPKSPLNFISAQTYNLRKDNKWSRYLEALDHMPILNSYSFLNKRIENGLSFNDLFIQILPNQQYLY